MTQNESKLNKIYANIDTEIKAIEHESAVYCDAFSKNVSSGIVSFNTNSKVIVKAYYNYISKVAVSMGCMEGYISDIAEIMLIADKSFDTQIIISCDTLLLQYDKFKREINNFIIQCEILISNSHGAPSETEMLARLSELRYKIDFFKKYIFSEMH